MSDAAMTALDQATISHLVSTVAARVIAHADELTALDQAIGDGDHGFNMTRGFEAVIAGLPNISTKPLPEALKAAGTQLVMKVGGASGPLYGTLFMALGKALPAEPGAGDIGAALGSAIEALKARGKSEAGQKTMLDVLVPVQAAIVDGASLDAIRAAAVDAAAATVPMKATKGRASFLGDRSIGHMDPGARSCQLIIEAICDALETRA